MKISRSSYLKWSVSVLLSVGLLMLSGTVLSATEQPGEAVVEGELPELLDDESGWTGDLDDMIKHRQIRALVVPSKTFFFLDGAVQRGFSYELLTEFEKFVNERLGRNSHGVKLVFVPVARDDVIPGLVDGLGDIAAANLTITEQRLEQVDFSEPLLTEVREIVVTGPSAPTVTVLADLAGQQIYVRPSSSYYQSLVELNKQFEQAGRAAIELVEVDEYLEDEDLLEMVNAGLIPMIIMDSHKAEFWAQLFDKITVHPDIAVSTEGNIGWAMRKDSPKLAELVNAFVAKHKKGTMLGNVLFKRYLENTQWIDNALSSDELKKFEQTAPIFQKYAEQYNLDWLLLAAQGYQESRLDQSLRSRAGAVGIMQILPSTARSEPVGISDIDNPDSNIHAGVKYLRYLLDDRLKDAELDPLNQHLFAFAAYNAGPARIRELRKQATGIKGIDPNLWFNNVENLAARQIGRETVQYVGNIYKYYLAYQRAWQYQQTKAEQVEAMEEALKD